MHFIKSLFLKLIHSFDTAAFAAAQPDTHI